MAILVLAFSGMELYANSFSVAPVHLSSGYQTANVSSGTVQSNSNINLTITIHNNDFLANKTMLSQGFSPSCRVFCFQGITYTLDPTILITNQGRDFEQCKIFGAAGTISCQSGDIASVEGVSLSNHSPVASDTTCTSIITTGGLADVAGTVTAGAAGSTVTTTVAHTFTAAETDTSAQLACLLTETDGGAHIILYAEGTFGPDTLVSGNTLALTWSIART